VIGTIGHGAARRNRQSSNAMAPGQPADTIRVVGKHEYRQCSPAHGRRGSIAVA